MPETLPTPPGAEQIEAFNRDLNNLINHYIAEFDLPVASMVGVLQMHVIHLTVDAIDDPDDENESTT